MSQDGTLDLYNDDEYKRYIQSPRKPVPIFSEKLLPSVELRARNALRVHPRKGPRVDAYPERHDMDIQEQNETDMIDRINTKKRRLISRGKRPPNQRTQNSVSFSNTVRRRPFMNDPTRITILPESVEWFTAENNSESDIILEAKFGMEDPAIIRVIFESNIMSDLGTIKDLLSKGPNEEYTKFKRSANPFELVKSNVFVNDRVIILANIDVFCRIIPRTGKVIFADLCTGSGGFLSYLIWRAQQTNIDIHGYSVKSQGEAEIDPAVVSAYGSKYDVIYLPSDDLTTNENIELICKKLTSPDHGLDLLVVDGPAKFDIRETNKENNNFRVLLCAVIVAINTLKEGGTLVVKVFEMYNYSTVCIFWILCRIFRKVALFKPHVSDPIDTERFIVCKDLLKRNADVSKYLMTVNSDIGRMNNSENLHVSIVDSSIILEDKPFIRYLKEFNDEFDLCRSRAIKKINFARLNNAQIGTMYDHKVVARNWLEMMSLPILRSESF